MSTITQENKSNINSPSQYFVRAYRAEHALRYGYIALIDIAGEVNEIKCEYLVKYLKTEPNTQHFIFKIDRVTPVYINSAEPDTLAEELAAKIGAVLYPLELEVNLQGEIQKIHNHPQIVQRWSTLKKDLLEYYEGEVFLKYITLSEQALLAEEILLENILQDWFICTYFAALLGSYQRNVSSRRYLYLPIGVDMELIRFLSTWTLDTKIDEHGEIEIKGEGEVDVEETHLSDNDVAQEDKEQQVRLKGTYESSYKLNAQSHIIESINSVASLDAVKAHTVKVDIYHLGQTIHHEPQNLGSIVVKDKWSNKGGFWSKIFKT